MKRFSKTCHLLLFIILPCLASTSLADDIGMRATVDKTEATVEDTINLSVSVSGTQNSPQPQLPPLPEFRVQPAGTSSSVQIINTKMSASVTFSYRLAPLKTGAFVIPPITLAIDGKTYSTEPITLQIKDASVAPTGQSAPVFAQISVSNDKPYVNEQISLTLKLFRRVDLKNINLNISNDGFRKEDLGKEKEYDQVVNGVGYHVHELSFALFPAKPGMLEIPPAVLDLDILTRTERRPSRDPFAHFFDDSLLFGGRMQAEHKALRTNPLTVKVQPLPEAGKPANFSNLVGKFSISADLGKEEVEAGDSATLTVTISGKGNVKDIPEPAPDLQAAFKVYPDQPEFKQEIAGNKITGRKIFKFALVPVHAGSAAVPSVPLAYFDPEQRKYVTVSTKPLTIKVTSGKEQLKVVGADTADKKSEPKTIKVVGRDILPIHTRISDFGDLRFTTTRAILYTGGIIFPPLLYLAAAYYAAYKRRLKYDVAYSRNRNAYKLARKRLDTIVSSSANTKDFARELSKTLREYIGDKTNLQGTAFTPLEMKEKLREQNYREDLIRSVSNLLEKCESLQYAPTQVNGNTTKTLLDESSDILETIEKQI